MVFKLDPKAPPSSDIPPVEPGGGLPGITPGGTATIQGIDRPDDFTIQSPQIQPFNPTNIKHFAPAPPQRPTLDIPTAPTPQGFEPEPNTFNPQFNPQQFNQQASKATPLFQQVFDQAGQGITQFNTAANRLRERLEGLSQGQQQQAIQQNVGRGFGASGLTQRRVGDIQADTQNAFAQGLAELEQRFEQERQAGLRTSLDAARGIGGEQQFGQDLAFRDIENLRGLTFDDVSQQRDIAAQDVINKRGLSFENVKQLRDLAAGDIESLRNFGFKEFELLSNLSSDEFKTVFGATVDRENFLDKIKADISTAQAGFDLDALLGQGKLNLDQLLGVEGLNLQAALGEAGLDIEEILGFAGFGSAEKIADIQAKAKVAAANAGTKSDLIKTVIAGIPGLLGDLNQPSQPVNVNIPDFQLPDLGGIESGIANILDLLQGLGGGSSGGGGGTGTGGGNLTGA